MYSLEEYEDVIFFLGDTAVLPLSVKNTLVHDRAKSVRNIRKQRKHMKNVRLWIE